MNDFLQIAQKMQDKFHEIKNKSCYLRNKEKICSGFAQK